MQGSQVSATNWGVRLLVDQLTRQKWWQFFKFQTNFWVNNPFSCSVGVFHIQVNMLSSFPHTYIHTHVSLDQKGSVFSWNDFYLIFIKYSLCALYDLVVCVPLPHDIACFCHSPSVYWVPVPVRPWLCPGAMQTRTCDVTQEGRFELRLFSLKEA